mmetsp:Transcript_30498/g.71635  ORF Transcript_30498/g.71635 Transcript_30498/m.71635 type:complete len:250 (+) Transcript_30498:82-831(+)
MKPFKSSRPMLSTISRSRYSANNASPRSGDQGVSQTSVVVEAPPLAFLLLFSAPRSSCEPRPGWMNRGGWVVGPRDSQTSSGVLERPDSELATFRGDPKDWANATVEDDEVDPCRRGFFARCESAASEPLLFSPSRYPVSSPGRQKRSSCTVFGCMHGVWLPNDEQPANRTLSPLLSTCTWLASVVSVGGAGASCTTCSHSPPIPIPLPHGWPTSVSFAAMARGGSWQGATSPLPEAAPLGCAAPSGAM